VQTQGKMIERNGLEPAIGSAHIFILPLDGQRGQRVVQVRSWMAKQNDDPVWQAGSKDDEVKILVIVHRMAANRLGFGKLYEALNDGAPEKFKNGFMDASIWPLRPFTSFVLPLVEAARNKREFEVNKEPRRKQRGIEFAVRT